MCWCLRLILPIMHNLMYRLLNDIADFGSRLISIKRGADLDIPHNDTPSVVTGVPRSASAANRPLPNIPTATRPPANASSGFNADHNPWFQNVDRPRASNLLQGNRDGSCLFRPSSGANNECTMTLIYNRNIFNVVVRRRDDRKLAMGSWKEGELAFANIPELVEYYQRNKLQLYRGGTNVGEVFLRPLHFNI